MLDGKVDEAFADQFVKVSANSNFNDTFLRAKSIAETDFSYSDESGRSLELDYNRDFNLNELEWAFNRGIGKAAGPDRLSYPEEADIISRLALLHAMNQVLRSGVCGVERRVRYSYTQTSTG